MQLLEQRAYLDRKEREHQKEVDKLEANLERQLRHHSDLIGKIIKRKETEKLFFFPHNFFEALFTCKRTLLSSVFLSSSSVTYKITRRMGFRKGVHKLKS